MFKKIAVLCSMGYACIPFAIADENPKFLEKLASPGSYQVDLLFTESICGDNDLQHVEEYDNSFSSWGFDMNFVHEKDTSVGVMIRSSGGSDFYYCSGTMIGDDIFLTASHCIDQYTVGDIVKLVYQYEGGTSNIRDLRYSEYQILEVIEDGESIDLDFAILRLNGDPGRNYAYKALSPYTPDEVIIIQHPLGEPMQLDASNNVNYNTTFGQMAYSVDTQPGSSGAGVLDRNGAIVAVHTHGGCVTTGQNYGTSVADILEYSAYFNGGTVVSNVDFENTSNPLQDWFNYDLYPGDTQINANWTIDSNGTPSSGTGPSGDDSSSSNGKYLYVETSVGYANQSNLKSYFYSPEFESFGTRLGLEFSYHMFGDDIGTLKVSVWDDDDEDRVWLYESTGEQQSSNGADYRKVVVDAGPFVEYGRFRFEYTTVGGYKGDIAIDSIKVIERD